VVDTSVTVSTSSELRVSREIRMKPDHPSAPFSISAIKGSSVSSENPFDAR
jgi:hypothetical protein